MNVTVEVDVALRRPPRVDATRRVVVAVDLPAVPSREDWWRAEVEARELASMIVGAGDRVVMPLGARVVDVVL